MGKIGKTALLMVMACVALSALVAMAAVMLFGLTLAILAAALAYLFFPQQIRAFFARATEVGEGWLTRIESLWADVRAALDAWGAREMQRAASPADGPGSPAQQTVQTIDAADDASPDADSGKNQR